MTRTTMGLVLIAVLLAGGCASGYRYDAVPCTAKPVAGGPIIAFKADGPGTAYLVDASTRTLLMTRSLEAGQTFDLDLNDKDTRSQYERLAGLNEYPLRMFSDRSRPVLYFQPHTGEPNPGR